MLFTDMLLVTKPVTKRGASDKLRVIKAPMRLDKIVVYALRDAGIILLYSLSISTTVYISTSRYATSHLAQLSLLSRRGR